MADRILVKRKKTTGNTNITIDMGEPYYNIADKQLFIGNKDGESVASKKHVAQITNITSSAENEIKFQIGEDSENVYSKVITGPSITGSVKNADDATNVTKKINSKDITDIFETDGTTVKKTSFATKAGRLQADGYVGNSRKPVYFVDGVPVESDAILEVDILGKLKFQTYTEENEPVISDAAVGSTTKPVYFSEGIPKVVSDTLDVNISKNADTATTASKLSTSSAGTNKKPVYFKDGIPVAVDDTIDVNISKNAATATTASTLQNFENKSSGTTVSFQWGPSKEYKFEHTLTGTISGTADNAKNVTEQINGKNITSIFESDGTTVKEASAASKLKSARNLVTDLSKTDSLSFDGSANGDIGTKGVLPITSGGTGATTAAGILQAAGVSATAEKLNLVANVKSDVQTQLDSKQATVTGAATTITANDLSTNKALVSNASGKVAVSKVTNTELEYLSGVTSNIQDQLATINNSINTINSTLNNDDTGLSDRVLALENSVKSLQTSVTTINNLLTWS